MEGQTNIFEMLYPTFKIDKPIRLIELFAGYGSQALALKYLGVPFEHWKICEWAVKSIQAYKDVHFTDDNTDYFKEQHFNDDWLISWLYEKGISSNYNEPMTKEQIIRLGEKQRRKIYNNIVSTHNLVNIQQVKGKDLNIIDTDKYCYLMTYSFPCQDLSLAGKRMGMNDTSTRSGMLWEVERILDELKEKPQVLLMENVPQVHGEGAIDDFNKWQLRLEEIGYKNYWQDLIATDYGIPQTRNRCFMVSILGDYNYTFPKPILLEKKLKDMLEDKVDEKYFLSDKMINYVCSRMPSGEHHITTGINMGNTETFTKAGTLTTGEGSKASSNYIIDNNDYDYSKQEGKIIQKHLRETLEQREEPIKDGSYIDSYNRKIRDDDLASTISTRVDSGNDSYVATKGGINVVTNLYELGVKQYNRRTGVVVDTEGNSSTLLARTQGDNNMILIKNATKKGYLEAEEGDGIDISSRMEYHRGTVQKGMTQTLSTMGGENNGVCVGTYQYAKSDTFMNGKDRLQLGKETSDTLQTSPKEGIVNNNLRIRKLTPRECGRLMGVKDEDIDKMMKNQSDSSLYHLFGDSIVVQVLMAIFGEMI